MAFADAVARDVPSLGVILYKYGASEIVHCFLAAIFSMLRWLLSAMSLPDGTYANPSRSRTSYSCKNCLICWLQKAGSLSVNISSDAPRSKKIDDSWQITLDESYRAKPVGPVDKVSVTGKLTKIPKWDFIFARVKTGQVGTWSPTEISPVQSSFLRQIRTGILREGII